MTKEKPLLVKIFIDGQNFYNRILDFDLDLQQIDYPLFFKTILDKIKSKFPPTNSIVLLKSEWYVTGNNFVDHYPWEKMRKKHLSPHFDDPQDPLLLRLIKTHTTDPRFDKKYKRIFDKEKGKDHAAANQNRRDAKRHIGDLLKISKRYEGLGYSMNGKQLDLIYIKYCGFLKIHHETRNASEKGVDVAIAAQMLSSVLDTSTLQEKEDIHDVIPDYNSDILVLISTDMDFIEPLRILYTMGKPVYMVHIQERMPKNLRTQDVCHQIHIDKTAMGTMLLNGSA
ncbi:MAG: hypothetical protein AAGA77_12725 [Bacteroidota bacterium]